MDKGDLIISLWLMGPVLSFLSFWILKQILGSQHSWQMKQRGVNCDVIKSPVCTCHSLLFYVKMSVIVIYVNLIYAIVNAQTGRVLEL